MRWLLEFMARGKALKTRSSLEMDFGTFDLYSLVREHAVAVNNAVNRT